MDSSTDGHDEVMALAIQYYEKGLSSDKDLSAKGPTGFDAILEYFKDYGLEMDTQQSTFKKELDLSAINKPGHYYIGVRGNNEGHALAAKVEGDAAGESKYTLFDPNYGEFAFKNEEKFQQFSQNLVKQLYPELMENSYVVRLN